MKKRIIYRAKAKADFESIKDYMQGGAICKSSDKAQEYIDDMRFSFDYDLENSDIYKRKADKQTHKKYGMYIASYKRNRRTQWYACYNVRKKSIIEVNKIISNYKTIRGI